MANEVATKKSLTGMMAAKFDMDATMFLNTIKNTVMPSKASNEEVAAFLMVAKEYDMNPLLREIHAFPKKGGGIQTVIGVDGWSKIITRHRHFDGTEFAYEDKDGKPYSCTCTLYRKDTSHPVTVVEFYEECHRNSEPWNTMPRRMLRHKALMQCGRVAFGLSGLVDEDEAKDFCEVEATVLEDDPLTPGRHESKSQKKRVSLSKKPEPAIEVDMPKDEPVEQVKTCDAWAKLCKVQDEDEEIVSNAIKSAAEKYDSCKGLKTIGDVDPSNQAQCSTILFLTEGVE